MESGFTILRKRSVAYIRSLFQRFRFVTVNREIMVFLLFLIVAVAFWLSQTFKDHTTVNLEYELKIVNVPKNLIFTSDVPSTIAVAVSGRGFTILQYVMNKQHKVLSVDYNVTALPGAFPNTDLSSKRIATGSCFRRLPRAGKRSPIGSVASIRWRS